MNASLDELIQATASLLCVIITADLVLYLHKESKWLIANKQNGPRLYWIKERRNIKAVLLLAQIFLLLPAVAGLFLGPPFTSGVLDFTLQIVSFSGLPLQSQIRVWSETAVSVLLLVFVLRLRNMRNVSQSWAWDGVERRDDDDPAERRRNLKSLKRKPSPHQQE